MLTYDRHDEGQIDIGVWLEPKWLFAPPYVRMLRLSQPLE